MCSTNQSLSLTNFLIIILVANVALLSHDRHLFPQIVHVTLFGFQSRQLDSEGVETSLFGLLAFPRLKNLFPQK
jgi:hypothetical protein